MCRSRSWTVICRLTGTSSSLPLFSTPTFWSANSGMNFATGSPRMKWPSSTSIMMPTETIGLVIEKMRKMLSCAIGAAAAGLCRPIASNQPIWPRRATMTVAPGRVPLSTSRLKASDIRCRRTVDSPIVSGLACGERRGLGGGCRAGRRSARSWSLPLLLLFVMDAKSGPEAALWIGLQSRFALAIGAWPMLETARTGACAGSLQECSSIGRAPVSKTGGRRFEPCHSCQLSY